MSFYYFYLATLDNRENSEYSNVNQNLKEMEANQTADNPSKNPKDLTKEHIEMSTISVIDSLISLIKAKTSSKIDFNNAASVSR